MKKEELKASLGKIKPREELVEATLVKMREQKEKQNNKKYIFVPDFNRGLRLAGAFCAFALVFCIGFFAAKETTPQVTPGGDIAIARGALDATTISEFESDTSSQDSLRGGEGMEFIDVRANIQACKPASDSESSGSTKYVLSIEILELLKKTSNFNQSEVSPELDAYIYCSSQSELNDVLNLIADECNIRLTAEQNDDGLIWSVIDLAISE